MKCEKDDVFFDHIFLTIASSWLHLPLATHSPALQQVGITRQEVERYWKRRDESSKNFTDKFVGILALLAMCSLRFCADEVVCCCFLELLDGTGVNRDTQNTLQR